MKRLALILTAVAAIACTTASAQAEDYFHGKKSKGQHVAARRYASQRAALNRVAFDRSIRRHDLHRNQLSYWELQRRQDQLRRQRLYRQFDHRGHVHYPVQNPSGFSIRTPGFSFWIAP